MGYFDEARANTERMGARLDRTHQDLSSVWRDATGRVFIRDSLGSMRQRSSQILGSIYALEDLERRLRALY